MQKTSQEKFRVGKVLKRKSDKLYVKWKGYDSRFNSKIKIKLKIKNKIKIKNTTPWTHVINDLNGKEITGTFYEKELQKTNQQEFRIEKIIKRKGDKLYVKWKGYDNLFNSWNDKKDII